MKINNHSTKNNILYSLENEGQYTVFDKVSIEPISGNLSFWSSGIYTGMLKQEKVKHALILMNDLEIPELPEGGPY
tara:strand:- start:931 stop:1158 length:228 start_codon:yes stop_codon:yes gene_type:complete